MLFENLSERLERSFKILKGEGKITEVNVSETLKDVRKALLDADVNYKVAKTFTDTVKQKALGQNVLTAVKPSQLMVKIVHDELAQLMGGETAEMPGMYHGEDYDVAGFCVGVVEKSEIIDGSKVSDGDVLIALGSSGPHSNGYSLVRKILEVSGCDPQTTELDGKPLADHLLAPTRIYVKSVLELIEKVDVHAIAHLTGGGFWENIPRVLPDNTQAVIDESSWQWPEVFNWLQTAGNVERHEMYRTFNCGVGMIIALPAPEVDKALALLNSNGENAWKIGIIKASDSEQRVVIE